MSNHDIAREAHPESAMASGSAIAGGSDWKTCDGQQLKAMIQAGLAWLNQHIPIINALNVFPVPDGDTGTNMYLTLEAAWQEIAGRADSAVGPITEALAHGALMGARGNSGVILSQIFRGMAQALHGASVLDTELLARAFQQASATAYKAVIRPVEGTILTVARRVAEASAEAAGSAEDLRDMFARVVEAARKAVEETPSLLPVLAEAGVVDAGGQGLYVILEGMLRYLRGESVQAVPEPEEEVILHHPEGPEEGYGYDVQFILTGENLDVERIRADIDAMGVSTLVVGDSHTVKVHVHTSEPGTPLNYAARLGSLSKVIVENMQEQYEAFRGAGRIPAPTPVPFQSVAPQPAAPALVSDIGIVAVVPGEGLARVFKSLGTSAIVPGGQTMNPSTEELLSAVESLPQKQIIILPNNKNVVLTAQQAQSLSDREIRVVPSTNVPQGISALLAFNYQADLDTNVELMTEALHNIQAAEVTRAVRSVKINGLQVEEGQYIGLLNGDLVCAGATLTDVVLDLLEKMGAEDLEIITLYYGEGVTAEDARGLADLIAHRYPDQEIEVVEGGQPHYPYIISGE